MFRHGYVIFRCVSTIRGMYVCSAIKFVLHKITDSHKELGLQLEVWVEDKYDILFNIHFSVETLFHLDWTAKKQKLLFREKEPPEIHQEKSSYMVTVWFNMSRRGLIGPIFLNGKEISECYLYVFQNDFFLQLTANGLPLQTQ